jgi:hypothetical protein
MLLYNGISDDGLSPLSPHSWEDSVLGPMGVVHAGGNRTPPERRLAMAHERGTLDRRDFLKRLMTVGVAGGAGVTLAVRQVLAMAPSQLVEGVRKVQGTVLVNGSPAQLNSLIFPGDVLTTGSASLAVFVVGSDAYLLRENSRVELLGEGKGEAKSGSSKDVSLVKVAAGKLLTVFGKGKKRLETVTASAGVRGTGLYVEADPEVTYLCLCYGDADLGAKGFPSAQETLSTRHHDQPRYILAACGGKPFLRAPLMNHSDEELIMLEALVGRKPPFGTSGSGPSVGY